MGDPLARPMVDRAEHPGIRNRLAARSDDPPLGGVQPDLDLHLLALAPGFRIAGDERVLIRGRRIGRPDLTMLLSCSQSTNNLLLGH